MTKAKKMPAPVVAYGYVGVWRNPLQVGWFLPRHACPNHRKPSGGLYVPCEPPNDDPNTRGETFYLCEIRVRPLRTKTGRPITRRIPKQEPAP